MYFLAFNVIREGSDVGSKVAGKVALACKVLPMGWLSSVFVMQEMSENILRVRALDETSQIIRNKAIPLWMVGIARESHDKSRNWWHVCLDNFAAGETLSPEQTFKGGDRLHQIAEMCWSEGVLSSEQKRKCAVQEAQELGAFIDGKELWIGGSPERFMRLAHATFWTLHRSHLSKKVAQVVLGRWVHVMQFRRSSMSLVNVAWDFVSGKSLSNKRVDEVRRELFSCIAAIPLMHTFLGSQISKVITASDASSKGGAVGIAHQLTTVGVDYTNGAIGNQMTQSDIPVLVISLFNGIGGALRTYDILGVRPRGLISFDIHKPANRITSRRWPHAEIREDVREFSREFLRDILARYLGIIEIHLWAGFPCVDLSSVKWGRKGLKGKASGLIMEVIRIAKLIKEAMGPHIVFKQVIENVASMDRDQCEKINELLGMRPYFLDCSDSVPMHRPRLCWVTESLEHVASDIHIYPEEHWRRVVAEATYPDMSQWLQPGARWEGGEQGCILPTCLKSIPRHEPPPHPAGIDRCNWDTLQRYEADQYRYPPYHYADRFINIPLNLNGDS